MVLTIYRTAYSGVLKNIMDYSAALCDADGRLAAQGLSLPGHLCSIPVALQAVLRHFGDDIAEGDILINNDPYDGGMHLPDIFIFRPLFAEAARRSPMRRRSATTPMSADACPAPMRRTAPKSTPRACASRR